MTGSTLQSPFLANAPSALETLHKLNVENCHCIEFRSAPVASLPPWSIQDRWDGLIA